MQKKKYTIIGLLLILLLLFGQATTAMSIHYSKPNETNKIPAISSLQYITFIGTVKSSSGNPIGGAKIEVTEDVQDEPRTYEGYTSPLDGGFVVVFLFPRGDCTHYYVKASKEGYITQTKDVTIDTIPDIVFVNFTLIKKSRSTNLFQRILSSLINYEIFQKLLSLELNTKN